MTTKEECYKIPRGGYEPTHVPDMALMHRDAHRRVAQRICAPAVTWHLAYQRKLESYADDDNISPLESWYPGTDPKKTDVSKWYVDIELLILAIYDSCVRTAEEENKNDPSNLARVSISNLHIHHRNATFPPQNRNPASISLLRNTYTYDSSIKRVLKFEPIHDKKGRLSGRYETVVVGGTWHRLNYSIRIEVFEEYFCITNTIQFRTEMDDSNQPSDDSELGFKDLVDKIQARYNAINSSNETYLEDESRKNEFSVGAENLFNKIWEKFSSYIFSPAFENPHNLGLFSVLEGISFDKERYLDSVFCDFRGIILSVENHDGECVVNVKPEKRILLPSRILGKVGDHESAVKWVETIFPLLQSAERFQEGESQRKEGGPPLAPFESAEYTFSTFCHRHYIYGSSFGAYVSESIDEMKTRHQPITYVVVAFNNEWRQLGRTILRLHTMGTLRLAALFELRKLMDNDQKLVRLEKELQKFHEVNDSDSLDEWIATAQIELAPKREVTLEKKSKTLLEKNLDDAEIVLGGAGHSPEVNKARGCAATYRINPTTEAAVELNRALKMVKKRLLKKGTKNKDNGARVALAETRFLIRVSALVQSEDVESYRRTLLNQVRKTLSVMDKGIRGGGFTYRAMRSKYSFDRYESLVKAMAIGLIPGYQPYDTFVRHRLERAYSLIQNIDSRYQQICEIEKNLRNRLNEESTLIQHRLAVDQETQISYIQKIADCFAWVFLLPYYLGDVAGKILAAVIVLSYRTLLEKDKVNIPEFEEHIVAGVSAVVLFIAIYLNFEKLKGLAIECWHAVGERSRKRTYW